MSLKPEAKMNSSYILRILSLYFLLIIKCSNAKTTEPFTLDDFLDKSFVSPSWNGTWVNDTHFYYKTKNEGYFLYNAIDNSKSLLIDEKILKPLNVASLKISSDLCCALIKFNVSSVYRHSTLAQYAVLDFKTNRITNIAEGEKLQLCLWSPRNNSLFFVRSNNVFYIPDLKDISSEIPLTSDGVPDVVYNGVPDWVYEEEVLGGDSAIWMSPFSDSLVFAKFDDTRVPDFSYFKYGKPGSMSDQYPQLVTIKYPKVNATNPSFDLFVVDLKTKSKRPLNVIPAGQHSSDYILFDVTWKDSNTVAVTTTNRIQNIRNLFYCTLSNVICQNVDVLKETHGWIDVTPPFFIRNNSELVQISRASNFPDLILNSLNGNYVQLTKTDKAITKILGYASNSIFFEGSLAGNHSQQHVYTVNIDTLKELCLTCNFSTPEGTCKHAQGIFSKNYSFLTKICKGPGPTYITIENLKTATSTVFESNGELRKKLSRKAMPVIKDLFVDLKRGLRIAVRLLVPPNFSKDKKYPLLVNVYAGPNSNRITDAYTVGLEHYLVTKKEYVYAFIDGRGSGRRGYNILYEIYKRLGTVEMEDQIFATSKLIRTFPFIDGDRVGIWGWSYGGFSTAWILAKDTEGIFKCGVSVAPVTDFIYYDSIYTERYMSLPKENPLGYKNTDLTGAAEQFRGKNFLLIHGNADDNVHYQQAMALARALQLADVPFEQISYPDENHSLKGVLRHLYHTLDKYWDNTLGASVEFLPYVQHDDKSALDLWAGQFNTGDCFRPTNVIFLVLLIMFAILIDY